MTGQTATAADLKCGDKLRNNDTRIPEGDERKVITITYVSESYQHVEYQSRTRRAWIKFGRIFTDGKLRFNGYNLIRE